MINIDRIKRKLALQAIEGKLTIQNLDDKAQDLYDKVVAERILQDKKFKEIPTLYSDAPFAIPKNWKWCNLSNIATIVVGATPSTANSNYWNNGTIYWLPSGCCHDCLITKDNKFIKKITQLGFENCSASMMVPGTTLLALTGATAGRVGYLTFDACANQSVVGITASQYIDPKYVYYSFYARKNEILGDCVGSAQPHFSKEYVTKMVFPLPPLEEQKQIASKLEMIFEELDKIDEKQFKLQSIQEKMKSKILSLAIQGKLVEQEKDDSKVTCAINLAKAQIGKLIEEGVAKKEKQLPEITDDEKPFDIPANWKWCRLADIGSTNIGLTYHPEDIVETDKDGVLVIRSSNIKNGKMDYEDQVFVKCQIANNEYLKQNDIVICSRNGSKALVGKNAIYSGESNKACFGAFMAVFRTPLYEYVHLYFNTDAFKRYFSNDDSKQINQVTQSILKESLIPIPPLKEQKRIVKKVNELIQNLELL